MPLLRVWGDDNMELFVRIIDKISTFFGYIAGILIVLGTGIIMTEIFMRSVLDSTIYITDEYIAYFMVAITFFGLAYTLKDKEHIRMTFLHKLKLFKGGKPRFYLDLYAYTVGLIVFVFITIATFNLFWDSVVTGTRAMTLTRTYLAIPQFAMPVGSVLITLQFLAEIFRSIIQFRTGQLSNEETESDLLGR